MSEETQLVLERLQVLLGAKPPHIPTARKQIDDLLAKTPCLHETEAIRKAASRLMERLAMPILAGDPEMREISEGLQDRLLRTGSLAGARVPLERASAWLAAPQAPDDAREGIPALLSTRLLTVLAGSGDPASAVAVEARRLLGRERSPDPWSEIERLLRLIPSLDPTPPPVRIRERQVLNEAVQKGLDGLSSLPEALPLTVEPRGDEGGEHQDDEGFLARQSGSLRARGKALRQHARSLAARITANKEMAERLRERLRQLEEALSQARSDGFLDPVTGLPDRFAFTAQIRRHLERAAHLREPFSLALLHFHDFAVTINGLDRDGESRLVAGMVREIRRHLRDEEYLARLSAERFVILFPRSDQSRAEVAAREIDRMLGQTRFVLDEREMLLEAYCGTAALGPEMTGQEMLELTDRMAAAARAQAGSRHREPSVAPMRQCPC